MIAVPANVQCLTSDVLESQPSPNDRPRGRANRTLSHHGAHWRRWDGRGLQGPRREARSCRGAQAAAVQRRQRPRPPAPFSCGGTRRVFSEPPAHPRGSRLRRAQRPSFHRHRVRRGADAPTAYREGSSSHRRRVADRHPNRQCTGRRSRTWRRAPRHQAGKRDDSARRLCEGAGLRHRQAPRRSRRNRRPDHDARRNRGRAHRRKPTLHVARADARAAGRSADGCLEPRRGAVRIARRPSAVRRPHGRRRGGGNPARRRPADGNEDAEDGGRRRAPSTVEGRRRSLRQRAADARGVA